MEWVKFSVWVETECEYIADMLKMLSRDEIEVQCEFCNRHTSLIR